MVIYVLMIGFNPALRIPLKSYFKRLNTGILMEVLSIGVPASIESVLFNGGKLLTQVFVAGMGTDVIAGNFIAASIASLINLPGNALGSTSTHCGRHPSGARADGAGRASAETYFLALNHWPLCAFATVDAAGGRAGVFLYQGR
ncbi:MATE family multidrug exporter [Ewingella americana]|uniref:MATE family multidrug exporter n=1 Tax=Ewingella americana TaxID=41202 RepID=A0A377NE64_9GAMM|nr:MATE family multidrug exporter [Ewingella americana]